MSISIGQIITTDFTAVAIKPANCKIWDYRTPRHILLRRLDAGEIVLATQRQPNGDFWWLAKLSSKGKGR